MDKTYEFTPKTKIGFLALSVVGILFLVLASFVQHVDAHQFWANILLNNLFFLFISLCGAVFIALHQISYSGWHTSIQRIPQALTSFLPISAILMFILYFGMESIYHWSHHDLHDPILEAKKAYLNIPFFFIRMFVYFLGWIGLSYLMKKYSLALDTSSDIKYYKKGKVIAAIFIIFFAITSSTSAWDWIMSIDAHWFSTLFGWFIFIGLMVMGVATVILMIAFLRSKGLLSYLNEEHFHDLGKYLFGFSIFWMYLWFFQYMLIWYGNMPEETVYYQPRLHEYKYVFFAVLIINFVVPFFALMTRDAKRNIYFLAAVAAIILVGQWMNLFVLIMPGATGNIPQFGFFEIGCILLYLGIFLFVVLRSLSKSPLLSKNDPLLKESFNYENL